MLGGMSWESSAQYYRLANELVRERLGGLHSARVLLAPVDFADIEQLQAEGRWDEAGELLAAAAQGLQAGGAELLLICTNTMHKVADQVQAAVDIPLLHLAEPTAAAITRAGLGTVGLLGTAFTMEQDFYRDRLASHGLTVLVPPAQDRTDVHRIIYEELCSGVLREESRQVYRDVITRLVDAGVEGVVLGCTEIELLIDAADSPVPVFPTTRLHVEAAVDASLAASGRSERLPARSACGAALMAHVQTYWSPWDSSGGDNMATISTEDPLAVAAVDAIHSGAVPTLRRLLAEHEDLATTRLGDDEPEGMSRTLLHVATDWPGHFPNGAATVVALVEAGANVNARFRGPHEETPLHWAASSDDIDVLDALLDAGANIEAPGAVIAGGTPLADATAFGQWKAARRLVERGAKTNYFADASLGLIEHLHDYFGGAAEPDADQIGDAFWAACHGGQFDLPSTCWSAARP